MKTEYKPSPETRQAFDFVREYGQDAHDARWSVLYDRLRRLQRAGRSGAAYRADRRLSEHERAFSDPRHRYSSYRDNGPSPVRFQ